MANIMVQDGDTTGLIMVQDWNNSRAGIEVHKPGCRDIAKKQNTTTYGVTDLKELVLFTYSAEDFNFNADTEWQDYLSEFKIMPCCPTIPMPDQDAAEIVEDAPVVVAGARGTHYTHAACGHELTPLARAACRATHTWNGTAWAPNA